MSCVIYSIREILKVWLFWNQIGQDFNKLSEIFMPFLEFAFFQDFLVFPGQGGQNQKESGSDQIIDIRFRIQIRIKFKFELNLNSNRILIQTMPRSNFGLAHI